MAADLGDTSSAPALANTHGPLNHNNPFLNLIPEIQHKVFEYLFCTEPSPIWLTDHYHGVSKLTLNGVVLQPEHGPIFHTQLFRVCKKLHRDAIMYAYSANDFFIQSSFSAFAGLGPIALSSIRNLKIVPTYWETEEPQEPRVWSLLRQHCTNLQLLEISVAGDVVLSCVRFLRDFVSKNKGRPQMALDLYVWDRHFAFGNVKGEYERSQALLAGTKKAGHNGNPYLRVKGLPTLARQIVFSADLGAVSIQALDEYLQENTDVPFVKNPNPFLPRRGERMGGGRTLRHWYESKPV